MQCRLLSRSSSSSTTCRFLVTCGFAVLKKQCELWISRFFEIDKVLKEIGLPEEIRETLDGIGGLSFPKEK